MIKSAGRYATLDVARGVAILGILFANISAFSEPFSLEFDTSVLKRAEIDHIFIALREFFVAGKFRGMLAILFGIGLYIHFERAQRLVAGQTDEFGLPARPNWPGPYLRRMLFLGLIGVIHGVLFWYGDILFIYSITAMVAATLARVSIKGKLITAGVIWGLFGLVAVGIFAALIFIPSSANGSGMDMGKYGLSWLTVPVETQIYQTGPIWQQILHRCIGFGFSVSNLPIILPHILSLMLAGMCLAEKGILYRPSEHKPIVKKLLLAGLGGGLLLNGITFLIHLRVKDNSLLSVATETFCGPLLAVGYLTLLAVIAERARGPIFNALRTYGETAMSAYLLQTLMATTLFYSFGFGLFMKLNFREQLLAAVGILVLNLAAILTWRRFFDIGPIEWAWRSMVEKRKLPWKKLPAVEAA